MAKLDMSEFDESKDINPDDEEITESEDELTDRGFRLTDELEKLKKRHAQNDCAWRVADENGSFGIFLKMLFDERRMKRIQKSRQSVFESLSKLNPKNIFVRLYQSKVKNEDK